MRVTGNAKRKPLQMVAQAVPLPAPVGGWDAISPLANMPVDRAVVLDNWLPKPGWIQPRNGFIPRATGLGHGTSTPVQTVMAYNGVQSANKLFGIAAGTIYDCTATGPAIATTVSNLRNSRIQYVQFANPAGQWLICCNGADIPKKYDGSAWSDMSVTGTGVNPNTFIQVAIHKGRLWFVQKNSFDAVYLPVNAIAGAANVFALGQFMSKGGYLVAIGTWTIDTRQTVDEYIAFISSRGQVLVYEGTDPNSADTWSLVGRYDIGRPIGTRCMSRISGDLLIISIDGVVGMSEMLSTDRAAANRVSLTSKIMNEMAKSAAKYKDNFGWQIIEYAKGTQSILNIPVRENVNQIQYSMNTITGAWAQFKGINANCWEVTARDEIFFGGNDSTVYQWDMGSSDNGTDIVCRVETAYNSFGNAPQLKRYPMLQPLIVTTGNPIPSVGINVDFKQSGVLSTEEPIIPDLPDWDEVSWNQFDWPIIENVTNNWISIDGIGHYVSIVTQITTTQSPSNPRATVDFKLNGWNITAESGAFV